MVELLSNEHPVRGEGDEETAVDWADRLEGELPDCVGLPVICFWYFIVYHIITIQLLYHIPCSHFLFCKLSS